MRRPYGRYPTRMYSMPSSAPLLSPARGASGSTFDLDLLVVERRVLHDDFWERALSAGAEIEIRTGDFDDPLAGVVRIAGPEPVDIIVGKLDWSVLNGRGLYLTC